ncbi:unnamed protein product, partial [Mesorhabditis belari]|uniref:Innexin n=1 Tax=Mesorhabditis belari TaxID=2138241 RepID=A0AAF3FLL7_9BILA
MFLVDSTSIFWGFELMKEVFIRPSKESMRKFPKKAICYVPDDYGYEKGSLNITTPNQMLQANCFISINSVYEQLYVFLFFWLSFLFIITFLMAIHYTLFLLLPRWRIYCASKYLPTPKSLAMGSAVGQASPAHISLPSNHLSEYFINSVLMADGCMALWFIKEMAGNQVSAEMAQCIWNFSVSRTVESQPILPTRGTLNYLGNHSSNVLSPSKSPSNLLTTRSTSLIRPMKEVAMLLYDRVANTANFAKGRIESLYNYGIDSANTVIGSGRDVVAKWVRIVVGTGVIFGLLALAVITSIISFLCDYVFTHWVDLDDVTGLIKIPLFFYKLSTTIVARVMKIEWNMGATIEQTSSYVRTAVGDAFTSVKQLDFKKMNLEEVTMSGIDTSNQHLNDQLTVLKDKGRSNRWHRAMAVSRRGRSRSLSRSPVRRKRASRSLSRPVSRSPSMSRERTYRRSRSRSPRYSRTSRRHQHRDRNPEPNRCLGVFNLPRTIGERDLGKLFGRYGDVDQIRLVRNHYSRESRGYAFVYFGTTKDATRARDRMMGANVGGREIRVDFSIAGIALVAKADLVQEFAQAVHYHHIVHDAMSVLKVDHRLPNSLVIRLQSLLRLVQVPIFGDHGHQIQKLGNGARF